MPFSILADVKTCSNQLRRATPHKRVSVRRFVRESKLSQQAENSCQVLEMQCPAQNGKDQRKAGVGASCKSELVRSISTPSTWMTMNCLQLIFAVKQYLEMHAFRCVVGLVMNWVDLIAPKVI